MSGGDEEVTIISLVHDILNKRSIVTLAWNEPDKRLALPVPYGTPLDQIYVEAQEAVREFADRFGRVQIRTPD